MAKQFVEYSNSSEYVNARKRLENSLEQFREALNLLTDLESRSLQQESERSRLTKSGTLII